MAATIALPPTLAARWTALTLREQRMLAVAAIALAVFLIYLLTRGGDEAEVELTAAPPPPVAAPLDGFASPPPAPIPTEAPVPAAAPGASVEGLVLHGVTGGGAGGGGAILGFPGGVQRAVRMGREFMPGVSLKEVAMRHVVLATPGGDVRLEFNKPAQTQPTVAAQAAPEATQPQDRRRETIQFRRGLAAYEQGGRTMGFAIRPGAKLPVLERAGLRPGDVILKVNGKAMRSDEKVLELSEELATSYTAKIEFMRGGQRMQGSVEINKRPPQ